MIDKVERVSANTEVLQSTLSKTSVSQKKLEPLLSSNNINVSVPVSVDLEVLASKLSVESSDAKESSEKVKRGSILSVVLANSERIVQAAESNMQTIDNIQRYSDELTEVTSALNKKEAETYKSKKDQKVLETSANSKKEEINGMKAELDAATAEKNRILVELSENQTAYAELEREYEQLMQDPTGNAQAIADISLEMNELADLMQHQREQISKLERTIDRLEKSINTTSGQLAEILKLMTQTSEIIMQNEIEIAKERAKKAKLQKQIEDELQNIEDIDLLEKIKEALKTQISKIIENDDMIKAERSEEEEKYLEENSPINIILSSLEDTIERNREKII